MAQTVHLTLQANGTPVTGDSTQEADGRKDTIECVYFESAVTTPRDPGTGRATGRRQFTPIKIRKRIDSSSPNLAKALSQNEMITGKFDFFRPTTKGVDEVFYTIEIASGFVSDIQIVMPDTHERPGIETREAYEEVTFTFDQITWTFNGAKPTIHKDSWSGKA